MEVNQHRWVCTEPGALVLTGTDFCVLYRPHRSGWDFVVVQGERKRTRHRDLSSAKMVAEDFHLQLVEIGVADE